MSNPLSGPALDTLFRDARSRFNATGDRLAQAEIEALYALGKLGPTMANGGPARFDDADAIL